MVPRWWAWLFGGGSRRAAAASTPTVYPASHGDALERVMRVIDLIAARPDISDEEAVADLVRVGIGVVDAELLIRFVPCALSFAFLKLMGLSKFPNTFQVQDGAGQWVQMPLAAEHYFSAALSVGDEVTTHGYTERVSKEAFQAVTMRSAEMDAVNQYFASGGTREGLAVSTLGPPTLLGVTAEQIAVSRRPT
jgi:hypothetical protein